MARRTEGFADGFQGGFGLINDFYATKAKQKSDEDMMDFRQEELGLRREGQEQAATAAAEALTVRKEERKYRRDELERGDLWRKEQRDIAAQNEIDKRAAKVVTDEFNTARLANEALRGEYTQGQLNAQERARKIEDKQALSLRNGVHAQNLMLLSDTNDHAAMVQYLEANGGDIFNSQSMLNIPDAVNPNHKDYNKALLEELQAVAGGALTDSGHKLTDEALASITTHINQDKKSHIGDVIGPDHVNAPKQYHGYTIVDSGISDAKTGMRKEDGEIDPETGKPDGVAGDFELNFTAWVKAQSPDGETVYYTAPVTNYGETSKSAAAGLTIDQGAQTLSGMIGFSAFLNTNPLVKSAVEEAIKIKKFGSSLQFEEFVTKEVNKIFDKFDGVTKDIQVESITDLSSLGFNGMQVGELLEQRTELIKKVKQNALYGPDKVAGIKAARGYQEKVMAAMPNLTYEIDATQSNKMGRRNNAGNIGDLVVGGVDAITPQMALEINQMGFNKDGVISGKDLDILIKFLSDNRKYDSTGGGAGKTTYPSPLHQALYAK